MTKEEKAKRKFRESSEWKKFRKEMYKLADGKDALTGKPLRKGWQVHHMDLNANNYANLDVNNFVCLNRKSHELVHFALRYDIFVLKENLSRIILKSKELNNNGYSETNGKENE